MPPRVKTRMRFRSVQASPERTAGIIEKGIINGEFKNSWNAKEFGVKLFAMVEGDIQISRVSGNKGQMP